MQKPVIDYGLLWFDDDPKLDLPAKVEKAANYFYKKYEVKANFCQVNPCMIQEKKAYTGLIEIQVNPKILPFHFWIGTKTRKN